MKGPDREGTRARPARRLARSWAILDNVLSFVDPSRLVLASARGPDSSPGTSASKLLPALLITSVLLCHGVLGFAHQVSCDACGPVEFSEVHHGVVVGVGEAGSGHTGENGASGELEGLSYAAVMLAAIGMALLVLLLGVRRWREASTPRSIFRRHYPPFITHLPRGPTLPSLQVLRL